MKIQDKQQKLLIAHTQVENLLALTEEMDYKDYIQSKLYKLKYEFERQMKCLDISV